MIRGTRKARVHDIPLLRMLKSAPRHPWVAAWLAICDLVLARPVSREFLLDESPGCDCDKRTIRLVVSDELRWRNAGRSE